MKDGLWGLRVVGDVGKGTHLLVNRKDGSQQNCVVGAVVGRMLLEGESVFVCTIATKDEAAKLAARPNSLPGEFTYPEAPIPPDDESIPF